MTEQTALTEKQKKEVIAFIEEVIAMGGERRPWMVVIRGVPPGVLQMHEALAPKMSKAESRRGRSGRVFEP